MAETVFTSKVSFKDAQLKAKRAGYKVVGKARNPKTKAYIVFADKAKISKYI